MGMSQLNTMNWAHPPSLLTNKVKKSKRPLKHDINQGIFSLPMSITKCILILRLEFYTNSCILLQSIIIFNKNIHMLGHRLGIMVTSVYND